MPGPTVPGGAAVTPRPHPVPASVRAWAGWSWRTLVILAALAAGLWLVAALKVIVVPVAVALLVTVLLSPVVAALQRYARLPRAAAAGTALVLLLALVAGLLTLAGRSIANGITALWEQARDGFTQLLRWLSDGPLQLATDDLDRYVQQLQDTVASSGQQIASGALSVGVTVGHVAAGVLIALFCTLFFLIDGRRIWAWVVGLMPRGSRERVHQAGRRGWVTLGAYTRTQILVAGVDAVGIGIGAAFLQLPLVVPLAVLVFFGSFIPFVGAIVTGSIAVLVALVTQGWGSALIMLGVVLLVQQLEGHVLQPFLMGHAVSLHPVAVLLVVTTGSLVAGIVGALFAVPLAALVNTVVLYLHGHDKFPQLGTDDHVSIRAKGHPVLDRAVAAAAEAESEARAARAEPDAARGTTPGDSPVAP
ncbi:AI-2E family transporter [Cellulomonas dongxiuzhuiae]|uniref:AI-2E family transporter n=1 Tax=Cellulomonas dongxiuzhuiae TaxID=2819979 RepID=A0ABX8GPD5_9CELL|nr:AI-2E family transporter [Cellulomonas dongxiuzhuiae]MBO3096522.1 AI-2E family transporter [Cellulomonas dongxiuzhuiae]QWC17750.1 AI-2E family transporter [Cellulomonas dongxiuzhuiae]